MQVFDRHSLGVWFAVTGAKGGDNIRSIVSLTETAPEEARVAGNAFLDRKGQRATD
jgi:hypothetical protein